MSEKNNLQIAYQNANVFFEKKDYQSSINQLEEIIKIFPNELNSIFLIIQCYIKLNNPKKALIYINDGLGVNQDNLVLIRLKIKTLEFLGRNLEAIDLLRLLIKKNPDIKDVKYLSNLLVQENRAEEADIEIQKFFEQHKEYQQLYRGLRHLHAKRFRKAEDVFKEILQKDPNNIDALRFMGILAFKSGNHDIAEAVLTKALKMAPTYNLLWANLAQVYSVTGQLDKAKQSFANILALNPENGLIWAEYGTVLTKLADYDAAVSAYLKAIDFKPDSPRVHLSLGHVYKTLGEIDKSIKSYQKTIEQNSLSGESYWSLANLKTYRFSDHEISNMQKTLNDEIADLEKIQMYFALGKAFESKKDFRQSFHYYDKGNKLKHDIVKYSAKDNTEKTKKTLNFFQKELAQELKGSGFDSIDPIFVLGMPRSGSTLVDQIISAHSLVDGTQELPNIIKAAADLNAMDEKGYPETLLKLQKNDIKNLGKKYIDSTRWSRQKAPFFIDKMPNNFIHIGLIKTILPNAKIIDTRRGSMDTCFSCFKQFFARGQLFTYSLSDLAHYYNDYIDAMDHWHKIYPGEILTVEYKNVIGNTETTIRQIIDYCGLPFEQDCLEFYNSSRPVKTPSAQQVRQPIYKSGMNYWENYAEYLSPLKELLNDPN